MATEDRKTLLRHLARAFNTRKLHALAALFSPHFVLHDPRQPLGPAGRAAGRQLWTSRLHIAPDLQLTMDDLVSEGDKVVVPRTNRSPPSESRSTASPMARLLEIGASPSRWLRHTRPGTKRLSSGGSAGAQCCPCHAL